MNFTIKKTRFLTILLYFLIKVSLDFIYCSYIVPIWEYMGFSLCKSNEAIVLSSAYVFLLSISVPVKVKRPSDLFLHILALCPLMPMLTVYAYSFTCHKYMFMCIVSFFIIKACKNLPSNLLNPKTLRKGYRIAFYFSVFIILLVTIHLLAKGGLRFFNLKLSKVYEFRSASARAVAQGIFAYLNSWVYKVFNMFLLTWALYKNKKMLVAISLLLQIFFYAISAHKSVLFAPFVILLAKYFSQKKHLSILITFIYVIGIWSSFVIYSLFNNMWPLSLFVRRLLIVPSFLNFKYYLFFQNNPLVYFSNSFLKKIIQYPYDLPVPLLISAYIGHNPDSWANTGYLAMGFVHLGYIGMILYSFIIGVILKLVDNFTYGKLPLWVGFSLVAIPLSGILQGSDLTTGLLTHGLGIAIILLWLTKNAELSKISLPIQRSKKS